jgi:hypothetical protein
MQFLKAIYPLLVSFGICYAGWMLVRYWSLKADKEKKKL